MKATAPRPNVIIITTDQQRCDSLGCYGSAFTGTPNIDRLAAGGCVAERAYCANPVCTPARASIFSGQSVRRHGAWNCGLNVPDDTVMLSHRLAAEGYRTHYVGKMHFQAVGCPYPQSREPFRNWREVYPAFHGPYYGFESVEVGIGHGNWGMGGHYGAWLDAVATPEDRKRIGSIRRIGEYDFSSNAYDWDIPLRLHASTWVGDRTDDFIRNRDKSRPFLLAVGFPDPHHPHAVPTEVTDRVRPEDVPLPRYTEGELDSRPPHFRLVREKNFEGSAYRGQYYLAGQGGGYDYARVSENDARMARAYYYTLVKLVDRQIGRILQCLDEEGLARDTLVVLTTDHGELLGDHGIWMKGPMHYEELVRIPMIVRWPARIPAGVRAKGLMSQVDIAPTVLAALGMPTPANMDGVNSLPLLAGEKRSVRDAAILEFMDDPDHIVARTVVTEDFKLTAYDGQDFGELNDLKRDPGETRNLWSDPASARTKADLLGNITRHLSIPEKRAPRICYA